MGIKENIHQALQDKHIVFADFEMIRRPRGSSVPTSIISAGLVFTNNRPPLHIDVAPEQETPWRMVKETAKFLTISKKEVMSGTSFLHFYKQLQLNVGRGVLVVWGDYDNRTLAAQCERAGIAHTVEVFNLQEAIIHYFKSDIRLASTLQNSSFHLPLSKIYRVIFNKEMTAAHHSVEDALSLQKVYNALTNNYKVKNKAIEIALMRLLQTHTLEALNRYMNHRLDVLAKNLAYQMHGTNPEKTENTDYIPTFNTLREVMHELQARVKVIESNQQAQHLYLDSEEEHINLSDFGPVDQDGEPIGW